MEGNDVFAFFQSAFFLPTSLSSLFLVRPMKTRFLALYYIYIYVDMKFDWCASIYPSVCLARLTFHHVNGIRTPPYIVCSHYTERPGSAYALEVSLEIK